MCNMKNKKKLEKKIREKSESLYKKRYEGVMETEIFTHPILLKEDYNEYGKFTSTFPGGMPLVFKPTFPNSIASPSEIYLIKDIYEELNEIAEESNVEASTLINCYLLQMLERNRETYAHTKARKVYVRNNLFRLSEYIKDAETLEEFEKKIFDKEFIKYKKITFKNNSIDEEIYIKNFLLNKGYTLEQLKEIEKEEKKMQGTFTSEEGEVMNPIKLDNEITFKELSAFNYNHMIIRFIPTRLGLHYLFLNKNIKNMSNYEEIEASLKNILKGYNTIWDLYTDYFNKFSLEVSLLPRKIE